MQTPIILTYHSISILSSKFDPYDTSVSPDDFAAHMQYLHEDGYQVVRLSDAIRAMRRGRALPPKAVAITFDDGYRDNYTEAFPVLSHYGFPATIYLVADCVGGAAVWDGETGSQLPLMTWEEAREMQDAGIEFGSHTRTHAALPTLPPQDAKREICASKHIIEDKLGSPVQTLAYPYEQFDQQALEIAEACGYLAACGSSQMEENYFNLWRVEIGKADTDLSLFKRKVSAFWKPFTQAKRALRPIKNLLSSSNNWTSM
jgi:peptidoglycan/xylan/chitin deacetylase (PgdA/CDA1 family)